MCKSDNNANNKKDTSKMQYCPANAWLLMLVLIYSIGLPTMPIVPTKWIFSENEEDFAANKNILHRPRGFCAKQVNFWSTKWILRHQSGYFGSYMDFLLTK